MSKISSEEQPLEQVITTAEASEIIGVSSRQVQRLCRDGKLEYRDAQGGFLILKESAERYAKRNVEGGDKGT